MEKSIVSYDVDFLPKADQAIDSWLKLYQSNLEKSLPNLFGVDSGSLARRIVQLYLKRNYKKLVESSEQKSLPFLGPKKSFFRSFKVCAEVSVKQLVCCFCVLVGNFVGKSKGAGSFLLGGGVENYIEKDAPRHFFDYCDNAGNPHLASNVDLFVQCPKLYEGSFKRIFFSYRPYLSFFKSRKIGFLNLFILFWVSLASTVRLFVYSLLFPELLLLKSDVWLYPSILVFNRLNLIDSIMITNSSYLDQEFWLSNLPGKKFESVMLWYSINNRALRFKNGAYFSEHPAYRLISVDKAYTWNAQHGQWLEKNTQIKNVLWDMPFVYQLPGGDVEKDIDVLLFDVTPVVRNWIDSNISPKFYYYYDAKNMEKFIQDVVGVSKSVVGCKLKLIIKSKRQFEAIHDPQYIKFLSELDGDVGFIESKSNVFDLIKRSKVTIVYPFSSPAHVAEFLGETVAYYDPTGLLEKPDWMTQKVDFLQSRECLEKFMIKTFD